MTLPQGVNVWEPRGAAKPGVWTQPGLSPAVGDSKKCGELALPGCCGIKFPRLCGGHGSHLGKMKFFRRRIRGKLERFGPLAPASRKVSFGPSPNLSFT